MNWFSTRKQLADEYEQWLKDNPGTVNTPFNVISYLEGRNLLKDKEDSGQSISMNKIRALILKLIFSGIGYSCHCYCNHGEFDSYGTDCKDSQIEKQCYSGRIEYNNGVRRKFSFNRYEFERLCREFSKEEYDMLETILKEE